VIVRFGHAGLDGYELFSYMALGKLVFMPGSRCNVIRSLIALVLYAWILYYGTPTV